MKTEYRIVWKRKNGRRKVREYRTKKGVERFWQLLNGRPWEYFGKNPDDYICCPSTIYHGCGCGGSTYRMEHEAMLKKLGPLEYCEVESRSVSDWSKSTKPQPDLNHG